jgi:hypothetical protein
VEEFAALSERKPTRQGMNEAHIRNLFGIFEAERTEADDIH